MRTIPTCIATQHPDNAAAPYWCNDCDPFISTYREITDCIKCYRDNNIIEYMWDWEGKYADAAVAEKLFTTEYDYFTRHQLGKDRFLTFRIPNIWVEKGYSLMRAMDCILGAEDFARDLGFTHRPMFEVILPMTERADQLMHMHYLFEKLADFKSSVFNTNVKPNTNSLELIPLVENVDSQQHISQLLDEYVGLFQASYKHKPEYIRPFLARSDPALVSGMLATALANKVALSQLQTFSDKHNLPVYPIAGIGSLPFRGGLTPKLVEEYVRNNPGVKTVTIQSSFRFDHPLSQVKTAVKTLDKLLPSNNPDVIDKLSQKRLDIIIKTAEKIYQSTIKVVAKDMHPLFAAVPKRRERRQHIGLTVYKRSMGEQSLPRAITFTAAFYSLGVPPEFISVGRTLAQLNDKDREMVFKFYPSLIDDLIRAGHYLNRQNLRTLSKRNRAWLSIEKDISIIEDIFDFKSRPQTLAQKNHANLTSNVLLMKNNQASLSALINETGLLRGSLG